jgi:hypothetical protein
MVTLVQTGGGLAEFIRAVLASARFAKSASGAIFKSLKQNIINEYPVSEEERAAA